MSGISASPKLFGWAAMDAERRAMEIYMMCKAACAYAAAATRPEAERYVKPQFPADHLNCK